MATTPVEKLIIQKTFTATSGERVSYTSPKIPIGAKTIIVRFKASPHSEMGVIYDNTNWNWGNHGTVLSIGQTGQLSWESYKGNASSRRFGVFSKDLTLNDGQWHTVKLEWNGTINTNAVKMYIDDMNTPNAMATANAVETVQPTGNLSVGEDYRGSFNLIGEIDYIDIYSGTATQVSDQLTAPEPGWKRYDDTHPAIKYEGTWTTYTRANSYNGKFQYANPGNKIKFRFKGTSIRLLAATATSRSKDVSVIIDGIEGHFDTWYSDSEIDQVLVYEKLNLENKEHTVEMYSNVSGYITMDALDIDSNGRLLHPDEVLTPDELEVGKRIRAHYKVITQNTVGVFSNLGQETYVDGINDFIKPASMATGEGDFYWICVQDEVNDKTLLIADRAIQHSISWDAINSEGMTNTGREITF